MPLYMSQISYTNEALKALVKHPQDRGAVFRGQVEKLGGRVMAFPLHGEVRRGDHL